MQQILKDRQGTKEYEIYRRTKTDNAQGSQEVWS